MFGDFFMFNKNNWKEPIYKNDLKMVLIFGITAMILGGIVTGLFDGLLYSTFDLGISFSLLLNSLIIGFSVKKGYYSYHILYPVLALGFFLTALFFSFLAYYVGIFGIQNMGTFLTTPAFYLDFIKQPVRYIIAIINGITGKYSFDVSTYIAYSIFAVLNLGFYGLGFYSTFRLAKGRNR